MAIQLSLDPSDEAGTEGRNGLVEIARDLAYRRLKIVNTVLFGEPAAGAGQWVLIDTGIPGSADTIRELAEDRFGRDAPPAAIVQTHAHFDHVGALETLAEEWDVPVYAHRLEHPYLNGSTSYPPADPQVGGGLMALLSPLYPTKPVDVRSRLRALPEDRSVPGMPGWQWTHTPGHTPGHISLYRESDGTVVAGDAFITTGQESAYEVATQKPEMHGPPRYFTPDWQDARDSVRKLAKLDPELVVTGHGKAVRGANMRAALHELADKFDTLALPKNGE